MNIQTPIISDAYSTRIEFSTVNDKTPVPNVLKLCKSSYNMFTQRFNASNMRTNLGLEALLKMYFGKDYFGYAFGTCKYNSEECLELGITFAVPLYVLVKEKKNDNKIHLKKCYVGQVPLITRNSTFILNGVENTVVNQLVRDSGIYINYTHSPQVASSIKVRGQGGRSLQFDVFYSSFIGRRLNLRSVGKKKELGSHQHLSSLLNSTSISFKDVADTLTYSVVSYKYSTIGWYLEYDWRDLKTNKVTQKKDTILTTKLNLHASYGNALSNHDYHTILSTKIRKIFIKHLIKEMEDKNYVLIDIYYKNGKSIFSPENIYLLGTGVILQFLKYIGKNVSNIHNMEDLLLGMHDKHDFSVKFVLTSEKNVYYRSLLTSILVAKKKKILSFFKSNKQAQEILTTEINETPFHDFRLDSMGRLRINSLIGTTSMHHQITYSDIIHIIRYLLQVRRQFVHKNIIEEQDLYNRRFNTIGMLIFNCLEIIMQDSIRKQNMLFYKKNIDNSSVTKSRIAGCKRAFEFVLRFIGRSSLCQYTEQANSLSYVTHGRKVSLMGPGGLKNDNVSLEMRDVHISNYGRLCPIETPEGKSVGVVTALSTFTRINKYNQMETPYILVQDGKVTGIIHYLTIPEERTKYIALATERCYKDGSIVEDTNIYCRHDYKTVMCKSSMVQYIELSPKQLTSLSSCLIPFLEHNDAIRALMGANMQRQAVPLDYLESPIISTGMEAIIARDLGSTLKTSFMSDVSLYSDARSATRVYFDDFSMRTTNNDANIFRINTYPLIQYKNTNQKTLANQQLISKSIVNNQLVSGYSIRKGMLSLGNTLLVGYTSMNGHTFEDSIVISERILREGYLQSTHLEVYRTTEANESDSYEIIKKIPDVANVDEDGIIKVGSRVTKDDILVCKEKRQLINYKKDKLVVYDKSVRYKNKKEGTVIRVDKFFEKQPSLDYYKVKQDPFIKISNILRHETTKHLLYRYLFLEYLRISFFKRLKDKKNDHFFFDRLFSLLPRCSWNYLSFLHHNLKTSSIHDNNLLALTEVIIKVKMKILLFYNRTHKYKMNKPYVTEDSILLLKQLHKITNSFDTIDNYLKQRRLRNMSLKLKDVRNSLLYRRDIKRKYFDEFNIKITLLEYLYSYIMLYTLKNYFKLNLSSIDEASYQKFQKNILIKNKKNKHNDILKMVKITIAVKHRIQVGDKLTGRYGNKGVISRILSIEDMPYLTNGTPLDIVLSPLGVSSRMNIGQLFESHLGVAAIELSNQLRHLITSSARVGYFYLRQYLLHLYRNKKEYLLIQNLSNNEVMMLYKQLSHGFPISSSIFDSISNTGIDVMIRKGGLHPLGKYHILDGITGSSLDNDITVGYLYVMKLNHLIDHKMHGRSTGPYNVITQQASKGKSRNGGQRLGEMEVWALQAYGAAYTLQEMLTFKSDSTVARTNFLQNFIKGRSYKIDIPRTFKLLRDELRVLGMELSFVVKKYKINNE